MSEAPSWLVELLSEHHHDYDVDCDWDNGCACEALEASPGHSDTDRPRYAAHLADVIWSGLRSRNVIPDPYSMRSGGQIT